MIDNAPVATASRGATFTDVYPVLGDSWRATCDCGLAVSIDTEPDGWTWILDHPCDPDAH